MLPLEQVYQQILDMTDGNPDTIEKVKDYKLRLGMTFTDNVKLGCLKYFAQKNYIEKIPNNNDFTFGETDSFSVTAQGITAWNDWFNKKPPKPSFY
jgi:hypothetical protein